MGSYTFRWPYNANEVFVTGTFDDWGKTVKLEKKGDVFEKEVHFPVTDQKVQYKFVVDGTWTTDNRVPEEEDGHNNVNNVLYPNQIQKELVDALPNGTEDMSAVSSVTPESTTAALAAGVPKEPSKTATQNGIYTSSAAPGSTTAELGKDVPLEQRANVLGEYSVNPIPASSGIGNPIQLKPGEKVPDPSTFNPNTVQSTVQTGKSGYEQNASAPLAGGAESAFAVPPVSRNMIPESSLPIGSSAPETAAEPGVTIQSAAPTSTTAGLAAAVPLESQKKQASETNGAVAASDVPEVVRQSISEAHRDPEAAANEEVVEEKKEVEQELQRKVHVDNSVGAPAPTITAATSETAPKATEVEPGSAQLSPRTTTPTGAGKAENTTTPAAGAATSQVPESAAKKGKEEKKKKRSSIFSRIKEKFK